MALSLSHCLQIAVLLPLFVNTALFFGCTELRSSACYYFFLLQIPTFVPIRSVRVSDANVSLTCLHCYCLQSYHKIYNSCRNIYDNIQTQICYTYIEIGFEMFEGAGKRQRALIWQCDYKNV